MLCKSFGNKKTDKNKQKCTQVLFMLPTKKTNEIRLRTDQENESHF